MAAFLILLVSLFLRTEAGQHHFVPPQLQFTGQVPQRLYSTAHAQAHAEAHAQSQSHAQSHQQNLLIPTFQLEQHLVPQKITPDELVEEEWKEFKLAFRKVYATEEVEKLRKEIFIENRAKIARFNQDFSQGHKNFVQRINAFGDMLSHEFNANVNGFNRSTVSQQTAAVDTSSTFIPSANVPFPESIDWRQLGAVSSVKNQQMCAGCWAYAAAGALEGQQFRKTGKLTEISVQNLLDCTRPYGNEGCEGGLMDPAFQYIKDNKGVDGEESYPLEGTENKCRFRRDAAVATTTGFVDIAQGDEKGLEIAVATLGPVTAAIDASRDTLQFYSDGVYYDPECGSKPEEMNHAVLIVGYGVEPNGQKYWLVKNSYGSEWGIGGYIKMIKDVGNHCGIATQASFPLV
ncbi:cathepsin L1-like [Anoplophora glabripennis]|uniref:cathepsin L1-like n=1 Tax=Anoplophora glabripennis TaxID=217634 RepID=UPI000873AE97|nr:cathepsin L1-like [Anoplophora glabripennis]